MAAAEKASSASKLKEALHSAQDSRSTIYVDSPQAILRQYSADAPPTDLPWQRASRAAKLTRDAWGIGEGPVNNEKLSELFQISADFFGYTAAQASTVPVGLRKNHGRSEERRVGKEGVSTCRSRWSPEH